MSKNRESFQSETGRAIDSLVSSSPLFYTVSSEAERQRPRYYEQLGCPSILKPSFRDLTGCTRLSVGVPSTSYRSFPLDKLNKTMGKSPTTQSKRYGEKQIPPIRVNAKIRHIYSHITSSQSSQRSSITTTSTQTDFDNIERNSIFDALNEDEPIDDEVVSKQDASTSMSPPPSQQELESPATFSSDANRLFNISAPYASKLEDLEKITGHIVIQRFFTRADDAFGSWLEKQLGMNNKSIGVGTQEVESCSIDNTEDKDEIVPGNVQSMRTDRIEKALIEVGDSFESDTCKVTDVIKCECFRDYYKAQESERTSTIDQNLTQLEQQLVSQCIEYQVNSSEDNLIPSGYIIPTELVQKTDVNIDETDNLRLSVAQVSENPATTIRVSEEDLDSRLKSLDLEWVKDEEQNHADNIIVDETNPQENADKLTVSIDLQNITSQPFDDLELTGVQNALVDEGQIESEIEDASPEQIKTLLSESGFQIPDCIPDVIEVSDLLKLQKSLTERSTDSPKNLDQLIPSDSNNILESQSKVAEYLADLERNSSTADFPEDEKDSNNDPIDQGESSGRSQNLLTDMPSGQDKSNLLKRSVSVDSCIGTESSGEARHGMTPVDSSRIAQDELGPLPPSLGESGANNNIPQASSKSEVESKDSSWERQESQDQEVITIMSSKSIDESNSRSEMSSAIKQGSDGEDADQSESDSELSSLRRPTGSIMSAVVEELGKEDIENALLVQQNEDEDDEDEEEDDEINDEVDQFDAIIESHEKEKRLRPVCRKRNATTQTTKSVESSNLSSSRSTTATSDSSFDLEFVSKSKKFVSQLSSGNNSLTGANKRRSYLPSGSSSLNVLNMKFTMGREFESEVSIRIPPKSPAESISSQKGNNNINNTENATPGTSGRKEKVRGKVGQDSELKNLWKDVKERMDSRVGDVNLPSISPGEMHVRGNRVRLIPTGSAEPPMLDVNIPGRTLVSESLELAVNEEEKIKRSLKRLKNILDN